MREGATRLSSAGLVAVIQCDVYHLRGRGRGKRVEEREGTREPSGGEGGGRGISRENASLEGLAAKVHENERI